jgi:hypothetical protein
MNSPNMPDIFFLQNPPFFVKHIWIFLSAGILFQIWFDWGAIRNRIKQQPELGEGYKKLIYGYAIGSNVPLLLMGWGIFSGKVGSFFEYLLPNLRNPCVLEWWGATTFLAVIATIWLFNGGAEMLEKHPGIPSMPRGDAKRIKKIWLMGLAGYLVVDVIMFIGFPFSLPQKSDFTFSLLQNPFFIWIVILVVFPVLFFFGWKGGNSRWAEETEWYRLAISYRRDEPFEGKTLRGKTGKFGWVKLSEGLCLGANQEGFYIKVMYYFQSKDAPPLFIPWKDIECSENKDFFTTWVDLKLTKVPGFNLAFPKKTILQLKELAENPYAFSGIV